jgi:AcrR family transcriptional regulator
MTGSPRGRRRRVRKEEILVAATELLLETGVEGFSLRELARRTDYTPGALYGFFSSKEALLDELAESVFSRMQEHFADVPTARPFHERLDLLSDAYMEFALGHPQEYLMVFTRIPAPDSTTFDVTAPVPAPWTAIVDAFKDGASSGELRVRSADDARTAFFQFFALHHGLAMLRLTRMRDLPEQTFEPISAAARSAFTAALLTAPHDSEHHTRTGRVARRKKEES